MEEEDNLDDVRESLESDYQAHRKGTRGAEEVNRRLQRVIVPAILKLLEKVEQHDEELEELVEGQALELPAELVDGLYKLFDAVENDAGSSPDAKAQSVACREMMDEYLSDEDETDDEDGEDVDEGEEARSEAQ